MKLLGDDCWWAPKWMKRLQERLGLGETELPDERKRPAVREPEEALVGAGAPVPPRPLPPHDPTHPAAEGSSRPGAATTRIQTAPARTPGPSVAGTTRMPHAAHAAGRRAADHPDPGGQRRQARNAVNNAHRGAPARQAPGTAATGAGGSRDRVVAGRIARQRPGSAAAARAEAASAARRGTDHRDPDAESARDQAGRADDRDSRRNGSRTRKRPRS